MPRIHQRICDQCGKLYKGRGEKFCSRSCNITWTNLHNNVQKRQDVRLKMSKIAKEGNYQQSHLMTREARAKAIPAISRALKGRKLTDKARRAIGIGVKRAGCKPPRNPHLVGRNHPNWRGGHSKLRNQDYTKQYYTNFRRAVRERDGYTCIDCGKKHVRLEVHHIKEYGPHPDLRFDPSNGVTLCRKCHMARHRNMPRPVTIGPRVAADLLLNPVLFELDLPSRNRG